MDTSPQLSVIIPVYNGGTTLARCLDSLFSSSYSSFHAIVVDDGSTDGTAEIAAKFPCRLIREPAHRGAAHARNRGAREATGGILFFLDADILVERDTLGRVVRTMQERPEISALFGSYQKNTIPSNFVTDYKNLSHHYVHQISSAEAATFCGGYGAVRREVFASLGGFDEALYSLEDIEFGYRLHRAGYRALLDKTLLFTHCKVYTLGSLIKSDVVHRAIPWTKLMLKWRVFRNDLNTKSYNVLSVILAFSILGTALISPFIWFAPAALLVESTLLAALNARFFAFIHKERGTWFMLRTAGMSCLYYFYSGIGFAIGITSYGFDAIRGGAHQAKSQ